MVQFGDMPTLIRNGIIGDSTVNGDWRITKIFSFDDTDMDDLDCVRDNIVHCPEDPKRLAGMPIGQYHCPQCGCMVLASIPHLPHDIHSCSLLMRWEHT